MSEGDPIRIELVERLATPTGLSFMLRAKLRGAVFRRYATVFERGDRFVAEIDFEQPIGPERQNGLVVMFAVAPEREAA